MKGEIIVIGARENNLKDINVSIPWHNYTVITGLSGSGKSSLALDTIYAEGLRRYVECLSTYARQFLERIDRPDMDDIRGLPPSIAIESRNQIKSSRSTVGTTTEIYDYLRLLFAKIGKVYCPDCGREVKDHSPHAIIGELLEKYEGNRATITFPLKGKTNLTPGDLLMKGFIRIVKNGKISDVEDLKKIPEESEIVIDRVEIREQYRSRIIDSLEQAFRENNDVNINILEGDVLKYSRGLECPYCKTRFNDPTPLLFSFNSPQGACSECKGFGNILQVDPDLVVPDPEKSLAEGAIEPFTKPSFKNRMRKLLKFAMENGIDINTPYKKISNAGKDLIFDGNGDFPGIFGYFRRLEEKNYKLHVRVFLSKYRSAFNCISCNGSRLKEEALSVRIAGKTISDLTDLPIKDLKSFFDSVTFTEYEKHISDEILKQIRSRTEFLIKVGLEYITLSRMTKTLSGGEAQRVSLACQLGSSLTETLYIMDEPSIGLHPRDINRLISIIKELRNRDNTVVVVEHDFEMIRSADYIIELGPLSGRDGGRIVATGSLDNFLNKSNDSITNLYMKNELSIPVPVKRRKTVGKQLTVIGASENNLKDLTVSFPLGTMICVTGVSGSGKSSLINDVLYSALARKFNGEIEKIGRFKEIKGISNISNVVMLDQSPIGKSSRSNPATYIKAYDEIRNIMANTWDARRKRFSPSHFSFNVSGGRCEKCEGEGRQKVEMHFLADIYVTCEECDGKRFRKEVLEVMYKSMNIDQVLDMTVDHSINFFTGVPALLRKLKILQDVGLGYLKLGQPAPTLSGGEAQRIKIARELGRKSGKGIIYILDEPTVGLHADDIKKLLKVLDKLVDTGNTVIVIEHNLDVIKTADHVIDLGPEGGEEGGFIVAEGTPEEISRVKESYTGRYLKKVLQ
jgi:excinuclease ABC subunit A